MTPYTRAMHRIAVGVHLVGLGVALYVYRMTGWEPIALLAGCSVVCGAYSVNALRKDRKTGVEA